ncbi:CHAT domain-containing protein [Kribbella sp. NBC_00382]|uniref:CHAT domain-containing protein n=1 Tax=Kribbella sp. NBC_00382 TaxID=2975967 RepID=UPI002E1A58FD
MDGSTTDPNWPRARAAARMMEVQTAASNQELADPRAALAEVEQLAVQFADDSQIQALVESTRLVIKLSIAPVTDVGGMLRVLENLSEVAGEQAGPMMEVAPQYLDAVQAHLRGDTAAARALTSDLLKRSEDLPDSPIVRKLISDITLVSELMRSMDDDAPDPDVDVRERRLDAVRELANRPDATGIERAMCLFTAACNVLAHGGLDRGQIDRAIADLREAVTLSGNHQQNVFYLVGLATAVYRRSEVTGSLSDVDEAIAVLEQARELAGGPSHPHWSLVNDMLSQYLRRRGEGSSSNLIAMDGLRGYAWQVMSQPNPGAARSTAEDAARDAKESATRCLIDGDTEGALRALDAGRGLLLFAATELRDPYTRLTDAGEDVLAERWRSEEQPSAWIRDDVIEVLTRDTDLLDPPTLEEIQDALGGLAVDALVYLVPAEPPLTGWAVIAPAEGQPWFLTLPDLTIGEKTEIERYLAAVAATDRALRSSREVGQAETADFAERLDALCGWAWKAAMGPIVESALGDGSGRVPRLVLIPMGDLARVPWQAARRPDGTYLTELVALSQAASARMLCASAAAERIPHTATGLMVADPPTGEPVPDLLSARVEAYAIHRTFYPGATYLGRRPDGTVSGSGAGTPDQVRAWLRAAGSHAGTTIHFATHGDRKTDPGKASSHLLLAGGNLTAEELIGVLDVERHPVSLVVLAGCHTGQSIHGYDEAYSLGTLFLAAGARSVLSTQWSIPDRDTSLLMYMFHHFLITKSCLPWDALRQAQLWMLDDGRTPPPDMPAPLRRLLADTDPTRITSWAGFVHSGQ